MEWRVCRWVAVGYCYQGRAQGPAPTKSGAFCCFAARSALEWLSGKLFKLAGTADPVEILSISARFGAIHRKVFDPSYFSQFSKGASPGKRNQRISPLRIKKTQFPRREGLGGRWRPIP